MSDTRQDFEMTANAAKTLNFSLTDGGTPLDLTSASITWRLAASPDGDALLEKTNSTGDSGITVTNAVQGQLSVAIGNSDIADAGLYWHFLFVTIGGVRSAVAAGRAVVMPALGAPAT